VEIVCLGIKVAAHFFMDSLNNFCEDTFFCSSGQLYSVEYALPRNLPRPVPGTHAAGLFNGARGNGMPITGQVIVSALGGGNAGMPITGQVIVSALGGGNTGKTRAGAAPAADDDALFKIAPAFAVPVVRRFFGIGSTSTALGDIFGEDPLPENVACRSPNKMNVNKMSATRLVPAVAYVVFCV
jgi:hypothetical protein